MQKPDNYPAHVKPLKGALKKPAPTKKAEEVSDPNKLNPVSLMVSVNDGSFKNASLTFSLENSNMSFS